MSQVAFPNRGAFRRKYGKQRRQVSADAAGQAVLDFGHPPKHFAWVVHHAFCRGAAGMTVRFFVGGDPQNTTDIDVRNEVDAVITTAGSPVAAMGPDEIDVNEEEIAWFLVTGAGASTLISGQIRYRILAEEIF